MGSYLNPGNEGFKRALRSEIYVDKTYMIDYLNSVLDTDNAYVCISRPRRFGKSMAANMLAAYYDKSVDSKELFEPFKISGSNSYRKHLNRHNVIFLNIQQIFSAAGNAEAVPRYLQEVVLRELLEYYPQMIPKTCNHLPTALANIYAKESGENKGFVFILDEWDCIFREAKQDAAAQKQYLDFLKDLLKDRTYISLAYMTGILPIKKYGTHSALNIFDEYSMTAPEMFAEYTGFTEGEARKLCQKYNKDFSEVKRWYDGYVFWDGIHVYNPKSVVDAMRNRKFRSFWTNTETYEALQVYIDLDHDGLKEAILQMLVGESYRIDTGSFQNDMTSFKNKDDILTLLVHLGYLAFDERNSSVFIPNEEVRGEFIRAIKNGERPELYQLIQKSDDLIAATLRMDGEFVAQKLEEIHSRFTAPLFYNNEQALRMILMLAYIGRVDDYHICQELPAGTGYADIVLLPKNQEYPPIVVELKWNKNAKGAIEQIKKKNYIQEIESRTDEILLVGISYDKKKKRHSCVIEKIETDA